MFDRRTAKVLTTLLVAMTVGALLLMAVESSPPQFQRDDAGILSAQKSSPSQWNITRSWRRIIVHPAGANSSLLSRSHFVIRLKDGEAKFEETALWKNQKIGNHLFVPGHDYNADSIGICLVGDFSKRSPKKSQMETLLALVRTLQKHCDISRDRVYLQSELVPTNAMRAFPIERFNASLANLK